jgi:hypothetical protein
MRWLKMINADFHMAVTKSARDLADEMDSKILAFFGSEEQVKAYAHLFIIEHAPVNIEAVLVENNALAITYHVETEIRIRPKTLAELEADK